MKYNYYLPRLEEPEDFDRVANLLTSKLGWKQTNFNEFPEFTIIGDFIKCGSEVSLTYNDIGTLYIRSDRDADTLRALGEKILKAFGLPLPQDSEGE
jgi:hypothetical protein